MRRLKTSRTLAAGVAAAAALVGLGAGPSGQAAEAATPSPNLTSHLTSDAPVTIVASGLNSPRSLAWGPHGHLLVSEVGSAPQTCMGTGYDTTCYGFTGSVADVSSGTPVRIAEGLASNFNEEEVVGPNGLAFSDGSAYVLETGSPESVPSSLPEDLQAPLKKQYGGLLKISDGQVSEVANPGAADYQWTLEHKMPADYPRANPYALVAKPHGGFYLVDAGSNTLDEVDRDGNVRVLAYVPGTSAGHDAVPTCVAVGPDGGVYVGGITGHDSSATDASVYRYSPKSHRMTLWQSGFSAINGCGFGANGDFYVTELDTTGFLPTGDPDGVVIQINHHDNSRTVLGEGKLFAPAGFLAGPDGSIYVANKTMMWPACTDAPACTSSSDVTASDGEIVKIG
ncbi:ScyD/ScyE family protein [Streptomyces sp. NK08204]|uniref:ScyD/ScyE family protein n=1 Tax=Streptomyces sp. NK08204 TaxID=2873260 RepID=UPI001CEC4A14|nr:ScyD/ScyE family protein [Streptomyces sp. NK08204]